MTFSEAFRARYEVERRIGAGGMGEVFLARERALDRPVAIKTVLAAQLASEDAKARFLREARITGALAHPCIVKVLDHGEDDGRLYIVFDFVEGSDLGRRLTERGALPPAEFFALAIPIADAVAHAHAAGVLHRDIKADNVLLDRQGNPRLADFGLARDGDTGELKTATGLLMGTPRYMAPELANGRRATAATDQYALGVLLYEMLAGLPPFDAPQPMALLLMHCDVAPTALSNYRTDVPHALEALVHRALAKAPEQRFPDVAALRDALQEIEAAAPAWSPRAAAGGATVLAPADAPALDVSSARVRRGSGRIPVPSGRVRAPTRNIVPIPQPPNRGPFIALAILALALAGILFTARHFRADPRYAALKFHLERGRRVSTLRWELPATLTARRSRNSPPSSFSSASATNATSLPLTDLGLGDVALDVELTDPSGNRHTFTHLDYPAVTLEALEAELARIRTVPGSGPRTKQEKPWSVEERLTHRFTLALNPTFGHLPSRTERYNAPQDKLRRALHESGVDRALAWYRENRLESLLEQAAALLSEPGDWRVKGQILRTAHAIANVEAFLLSSGLVVPCPALRFQYGLAPGTMPGSGRPVLDGPGDFARSNWYTKLLHNDHELKSAHRSLKDGLDLTKWHAKAVDFQLTAQQRKPRAHDPVGGLLAAANSDEAFPPEYQTDGIGTGWSQMVLEPVTLAALKLDPPPPDRTVTGAAILLHLRGATELTHVDITLGTALLFCFRTPPGYVGQRDIHAWAPIVGRADLANANPILSPSATKAGIPHAERPGLVHLARFDTAALAAGPPVISVHCARGDGLLDQPTYWMQSWKTPVSKIGVRYEVTSVK